MTNNKVPILIENLSNSLDYLNNIKEYYDLNDLEHDSKELLSISLKKYQEMCKKALINIEDIIEGVEPWIASQSYASFANLADSWGTSSNDLHFLAPDSASKLQNIGYYEQDFVFKSVGDVEFTLGHYHKNEFSPRDLSGEDRMATYRADYRKMDFNDANFFLNREIRDKGKGYTYDSYIRKSTSDKLELILLNLRILRKEKLK